MHDDVKLSSALFGAMKFKVPIFINELCAFILSSDKTGKFIGKTRNSIETP